MKWNKAMNKTTYILMIVSLLIPMLFSWAPAAGAETGDAGQSFADVPDSDWAYKHIAKMELQGIVTGYGGLFRPNDPVKQVEAITMAIRAMGLEADAKLVTESRQLPFDVPAWSKGYVAVALDKGLIKESEVFEAEAGANRAWVAQLMVRTIGKDADAATLAGANSGFSDHYNIPFAYIGYVNAAVKYELVKGYTDGTFQPNKPVTRREMTKLLSVSDRYLTVARENVDRGVYVRANGSMITIRLEGGSEKSFITDNGTLIYDGDNRITLQNLPVNSGVMVISRTGGAAKFIEVAAAQQAPALSVLTGTVLEINLQSNLLVVQSNDQLVTLPLDAAVTYKNQFGQPLTLQNISVGDQVEVSRDTSGKTVSITVTGMSGNAQTTGVVISVNQTSKLITVQTSAGTPVSYFYSDQVAVEYAGQRFPTIADIQAGDKVQLEVAANYVTKIVILETSVQLNDEGKVVSVTANSDGGGYITLQTDKGLKAYQVSKEAEILVSGLDIASLSDVVVGDQVQVEVSNGTVQTLQVLNREVESMVKGEVVAVDLNNRMVIYENEDGDTFVKKVSPYAEFIINDLTNPDLDDVQVGMEIIMQLEKDEIILLRTNNRFMGKVNAISETSRQLQLQLSDSNERKTYVLASDVDVNIFGESNEDLGDVEQGDTVEVTVENNVVTSIDVQTTAAYTVEDVNTSRNRLEVEDEHGDEENLYIRSGVELVIPGVKNPDIEDVKEGDTVRATFIGNSLVKVEVLPAIHGTVQSLNILSGIVTVEDFSGKQQTVELRDGTKIVVGSQTYTRIDALAIGDRVEIRENTDGSLSILVMAKISSQFVSLDSDLDRMYVKMNGTVFSWYSLSEQVYIHTTVGQAISLRNLAVDDQLELYMLNDKVYEIVKLN